MANLTRIRRWFTTAGSVLCLLLIALPSSAMRVKDLVSVNGVRNNQLVGYGLVVGLDGTGDQTTQTPFTVQSFISMLNRLGVAIPANMTPQLKNVAAVALSADLPPYAKPGQTIDITVSSLGNAKSLRGGTLLLSPLKGSDGEVYAMAQGNLVVGGFGAQGSDGSKITVNVPSVGRIPGGATVERTVPNAFALGDNIIFNLNQADFTTAKHLAEVINQSQRMKLAQPMDAGSVHVLAPKDPAQRVAFLSVLENLEVKPGEAAAKVIVNSRTGTIVIGQHVRVLPAAVTHGSLVVTITENKQVSQPGPLSSGTTAVTNSSTVQVDEQAHHAFVFEPGTSLHSIVKAINKVGAAPGDLIAILDALKQAGALQADLEII